MRSALFVALSALAGCSAGDGVVGGRCREGFVQRNGACLAEPSPASDSSSPSYAFATGTASPLSPAAAETPDASTTGSSSSSGSSQVGSSEAGGGASSAPCPDGVVPSAPPEVTCDGPLVACHGACIPVAGDADNCGACGKICPSNICVEGECQGALAGDVIALGHDSSSPYAKMVANALSIATTDPIRVLAYDAGDANAAAERTAIASSIRFRRVAFTVAKAADLEALDLAKSFDVVLVQHAGVQASYMGARSRSSLETFTKRGGIVVALDDGASDLPAFLRDSALLAVDGHQALAGGTQIVVSAPNDALGMQVLSPYAPSDATVSFVGVQASPDVTVVAHANDDDAYPTAVHRFVR